MLHRVHRVDDDGWRPSWLRRRVFLAFAAWFAALFVAIESLAAISLRDTGIATPGNGSHLHYLWSFGPVACLGVTSALFNRSSYQAMRFMPWIQLRSGPSPRETTLDLGYDAMLSPVATVAALRNRHFLVAIAIAVSLVLKTTTVLASALLFVREVDVTSVNVPFVVQDAFLPEMVPSSETEEYFRGPSLVWPLRNILNTNSSLPWGYALHAAHQIFTPESGSDTKQLEAVVQGMWSDLECVAAEPMSVDLGAPTAEDALVSYITYTFTSPFCNDSISARQETTSLQRGWVVLDRYFGTGEGGDGGCQGATGPVFMMGSIFQDILQYPVGNLTASKLAIMNSSVVTCKPSYTLGRVRVAGESASPLLEEDHCPLGGDMTWVVMASVRGQRGLPTNYTTAGFTYFDFIARGTSLPGEEIRSGFKLLEGGHPVLGDLTTDNVISALTAFYRTYPPLLAHLRLRQQGQSTVTGTQSQRLRRLMVESAVAHSVAGALGASALLLLLSAFCLVPRRSFTPCDPEPLMGTLMLLSGSSDVNKAKPQKEERYWTACERSSLPTKPSNRFVFRVSDANQALMEGKEKDEDASEQGLTWYQPGVLRYLPRILISLILIGLIAALVSLYLKSNRESGIATASTGYLRFFWSVLPTMGMAGLSIYFTAADHHTRVMAPLIRLRRKAATVEELLTSSLADQTALFALASAARQRSAAVVLSTTASLTAGFLTIFAATLFSPALAPTRIPVLVQQEDWFAPLVPGAFSFVDSSVGVVVDEPTPTIYAPGTYEDLVFPAVSVPQPPSPDLQTNNMTVSVRVSAMRPMLSCTRIPTSSLTFEFNPANGRVKVAIDDSDLPPSVWSNAKCGSHLDTFVPLDLSSGDGSGLFHKTSTPQNANSNCSTLNFFWGELDPGKSTTIPLFTHLAAYACRDHIDDLLVDVTFSYPSLQVAADRPPIPVESTAVPSDRLMAPVILFNSISDTVNDTSQRKVGLTPDLPSSRYRISNEWLTNPGHEDAVLAAHISYTTRYLAALYSQTLRRLYSQPAEMGYTVEVLKEIYDGAGVDVRLPSGPMSATKPEPMVGSITDWTEQRVVQSRDATVVLVVVLLCLLVLNSLAMWRKVGGAAAESDVVMEDPGTIAAMGRLMEGANLYDYLHAGGDRRGESETERWNVTGAAMTEMEFQRALKGKRLRLGLYCKKREDGEEQKLDYGICVDDDDDNGFRSWR